MYTCINYKCITVETFFILGMKEMNRLLNAVYNSVIVSPFARLYVVCVGCTKVVHARCDRRGEPVNLLEEATQTCDRCAEVALREI